jgi:hypothetical protein
MAIPKPGPKGLPKRDDEIYIVGLQLRLGLFFLSYWTFLLLEYQNTQSGSQWDGLKHIPLIRQEIYYNKYVKLAGPYSRFNIESLYAVTISLTP